MTWENLTPRTYRGIVVDPPWPYDITDRTKAEAARQYSLMTMGELEELPVADLADPDGAVLFCWATNRHLADGRAPQLVQSWGFRPVTLLTWRKTGQPGVGRWVRANTEHVIVATIGQPPVPEVPLMASCFDAPRPSGGSSRSHSRKPPVLGDLVEQTTPGGPWVELFCRQPRLNWSSWGWGHELELTRGTADQGSPGRHS